ncbi:TPA: DUF551 domain-containing protein [Raoultella ornithinolytica]
MDGEPVAEVLSNRPGNDTSTIDRALPVGTQIYRHAQQLVVPPMQHWEELCREYPDMSIGDAIIRAAWWNHCRAAMLQAGSSPAIPDGYVMVPKEPTDEMIAAAMNCDDVLFNSDESFCVQFGNIYEAMLAAGPQLPGSDPATVPGKWIPVSERMPEVGDIVLTAMGGSVNVGEMERSGANYRYFTSVISGRELPATHWMPLPAAPQEVKSDINALIPLVSRNEQEVK